MMIKRSLHAYITKVIVFYLQHKLHSKKEAKKTSLKDLCREDKQRVANLIKELARCVL